MKVGDKAVLRCLDTQYHGDNQSATIRGTDKKAYEKCVRCGERNFPESLWKPKGYNGKEPVLHYRRLICASDTCKSALRKARETLSECNCLWKCYFGTY